MIHARRTDETKFVGADFAREIIFAGRGFSRDIYLNKNKGLEPATPHRTPTANLLFNEFKLDPAASGGTEQCEIV